MKTKRMSAALIAVVLAALLLLTACGGGGGGSANGLSGTYSDEAGDVTFTFSGRNNLRIEEDSGFFVSGTYSLSDGVITFTPNRDELRAMMESEFEEMGLSAEEIAEYFDIDELIDDALAELSATEITWDEETDTIEFEGMELTKD